MTDMTTPTDLVPSPAGGGTAAEGDCFTVAAHLMCFWDAPLPDGTLCHAVIVGSGPLEGMLHWHAWVEVRRRVVANGFRVTRTFAIDLSNGKQVVVDAGVYRRAAQAQGVMEYTREEAREWMRTTEHYGPWEDDPDGRDAEVAP